MAFVRIESCLWSPVAAPAVPRRLTGASARGEGSRVTAPARPRVHAVQLKLATEPAFPDECVACRAPSPARRFTYVTRDGLQGRALWRGWLVRRVPACRDCGIRLQLGLVWRFVRTVVVGIGSTGLAAWLLHRQFSSELALALTCFGVTCVSLVVLVIWEQTHPPVFAIEAEAAGATYNFRERAQAERFARANGLAGGDSFGH